VLPGRKYTPEEILRIGLHRWWLIVFPLCVFTVAAVIAGRYLPDRYRSETLIMLVPQRIPDSYVKSTVATPIESRLATLKEQIMSRSRLERIILDLGLYPSLRQRLPMEDVVQRMRDDIDVKTTANESFRVSYVSQDARTAQKATERLASLFIEESLRDRENVAEDTNQFLESQLQDARRRLVEQEKKLEEYRRRYSGQLPTQLTANMQSMSSAQLQLQSVNDATDRARERRVAFERQLADLQAPDPALAVTTAAPKDGTAVESTAQLLERARADLQLLQLRYTPDHPDVRRLQRTVRDLEAKQQSELKSGSTDATVREPVLTPLEAQRQKRIRDLKAQIADVDAELKGRQQDETQLRTRITEYQAKLDAVPTRESELVELTRDYTTLQTTYQSLLQKREDSQIAANLERRNIGEQFRVLDPARVPERPFSPNRLLINLGSAGAGLALGLVLIGFLEYRDSSFRLEGDVERLLNLPVLAMVPLMMSNDEQRRARRLRAVRIAGLASMAVLLAMAAAVVLWRFRA
jgi:polysaccharide chain length determinant protein (PEP-CTERM system associated)